jgi:hypothetical protein
MINICLLKIELSFRPHRAGHVTILGLTYRLNILVQNISDQTAWPYGIMGKTLFHVKGIRLNSNRKERLNVMYAVDRRLELQIVPDAPLLHVSINEHKLDRCIFSNDSDRILCHANINVLRRNTIVFDSFD